MAGRKSLRETIFDEELLHTPNGRSSNSTSPQSSPRSTHRHTRRYLGLVCMIALAVCLFLSETSLLGPIARILSSHDSDVKKVNWRTATGQTPSAKIERIVLLGERHSGTSYATEILQKCFPDLEVTDLLARYKHWFQPTPEYVMNITKHFLQGRRLVAQDDIRIKNEWPNISEDPEAIFENTLVIVMFRNTYEWMEAMRTGPHHMTNHFHLYRFPRAPVPDTEDNSWYGSKFLDWKQFIAANMTHHDDASDYSGLCQNAYLPGAVTPCILSKDEYPPTVKRDYEPDMSAAPEELPFSAHLPMYEMGPDRKPFQNPLEMRTAKIQNMLDIPKHWNLGGFMTLQYEDLNKKGPEFFLNAVSKKIESKATCKADPPQNQESKQLDHDWAEWISENADWETEAKIGYERRPASDFTPALKINRIALIGERHSGTSYTTKMLEKCFPSLEVNDFLVRYKHWFQPSPEFVVKTSNRYFLGRPFDENKDMRIRWAWPEIAELDKPKTAFETTMVIAMFRNPYDWIEEMRTGPYHWPNHFSLYRYENHSSVGENGVEDEYGVKIFPWQDFVAANLTYNDDDGYDGSTICQYGYEYGSVTPCIASKGTYPPVVKTDYASDLTAAPDILSFAAHEPIYEMDQNGKPFMDPLRLRAAKINDFLDIPNKWDLGGFVAVQLEEMNAKGSQFLLDAISEAVGIEPSCDADPPKEQERQELNASFSTWVTINADWETESKVGYSRRPTQKIEPTDTPMVPAVQPKPVYVTSASDSVSLKRIILLGERHSGTTYTTEVLKECFPSIEVDDFLVRYKHWLQPTPDYVGYVAKTFLKPEQAQEGTVDTKIQNRWPRIAALENPKSAFKDTLVIVMFRNAYDWLEAMREGPHHWPNHMELYRHENGYGTNILGWKAFVDANMTLQDDGSDGSQLCQNAYPHGMLSPCILSKDIYPAVVKKDYASDLSAAPDVLNFNAHSPIYEFDENGNPFNHPLQLRVAKIKDFLDIPNKWDLGGFMTLQHEQVNMKGSGFLLETVSKLLGIKPTCQAAPPMKQKSKDLDRGWEQWISEHADWEIEGKVGYERRPLATAA